MTIRLAQTQHTELSAKYDDLTEKIQALEKDLSRTLGALEQLPIKANLTELNRERDEVAKELGKLEGEISPIKGEHLDPPIGEGDISIGTSTVRDQSFTAALSQKRWQISTFGAIGVLMALVILFATSYARTASSTEVLNAQQITMASRQMDLEKRLEFARSSELAERANRELTKSGSSWTMASLLSVESLRRDPTNALAMETGYRALLEGVHLIAEFHHDQIVHALQFSPDGKYIATGNGGGGWESPEPSGTLRVSEARTGREVFRLRSSAPVTNLAFTRDGRWIIAAVDGYVVVSYDLGTGRHGVELVHGDKVNAFALNYGDARIATASDDYTAKVWDLKTGQLISRVWHTSPVTAITFSPDGEWIASGDKHGTVVVWHAGSGTEIGRMELPQAINTLSFSPDREWLSAVTAGNDSLYSVPESTYVWEIGSSTVRSLTDASFSFAHAFSTNRRWLARGTGEGAVEIWNTRPYKKVQSYWTDGSVHFVGFSPDGQYVISAENCGDEPRSLCARQVYVERTEIQSEVARIEEEANVNVAAISNDNNRIALALLDGTVQIWELTPGEQPTKKHLDGSVFAADFSPDGKKIAAGGIDGRMRAWSANTAEDPQFWDYGSRIDDAVYSPDGRYVAVGGEQGEISIWSTSTETVTQRLRVGAPILSLDFSPNGRQLAVGTMSSGGTSRVGVWQSGTWERQVEWQFPSSVESLDYSPDNNQLAVGDDSGTVFVLDVDTAQIKPKMTGTAAVKSIKYAPDAKVIISGGQEVDGSGSVNGWDAASGNEIWHLSSEDPILTVDISSDGKWMASGDQAGVLRVWKLDVDKNSLPQEIARLKYGDPLRVVQFGPDGTMLMVASGSTVNVSPWWPNLTDELCKRVARNLSQQEWQMLFAGQSYQPTCPDQP